MVVGELVELILVTKNLLKNAKSNKESANQLLRTLNFYEEICDYVDENTIKDYSELGTLKESITNFRTSISEYYPENSDFFRRLWNKGKNFLDQDKISELISSFAEEINAQKDNFTNQVFLKQAIPEVFYPNFEEHSLKTLVIDSCNSSSIKLFRQPTFTEHQTQLEANQPDAENRNTRLEKREVLLEEFFNDQIKKIHLIGPPGSGKSTTCRHIIQQKANNFLWEDYFQSVIYLPLNEIIPRLEQSNDFNLIDLLYVQYFKSKIKTRAKAQQFWDKITHSASKILFVIDDFDEISLSAQRNMERSVFPNLQYFILASRPHVQLNTEIDNVISINPLNESDIENYIREFFETGEERKSDHPDFQAWLNEHENIKTICQSPMMLEFACQLWEEHEDEIENITDLYNLIAHGLMKRHFRKTNPNDSRTDEQYRNDHEYIKIKIFLSALAFRGFQEERNLFFEEDVSDIIDENEILTNDHDFIQKSKEIAFLTNFSNNDTETIWQFSHQSLQECFAANYIAENLSNEDVIHFFQENKYNPKYHLLFAHAISILRDDEKKRDHFFGLLFSEPRDIRGEYLLSLLLRYSEICGHPENTHEMLSEIENLLTVLADEQDCDAHQFLIQTLNECPQAFNHINIANIIERALNGVPNENSTYTGLLQHIKPPTEVTDTVIDRILEKVSDPNISFREKRRWLYLALSIHRSAEQSARLYKALFSHTHKRGNSDLNRSEIISDHDATPDTMNQSVIDFGFYQEEDFYLDALEYAAKYLQNNKGIENLEPKEAQENFCNPIKLNEIISTLSSDDSETRIRALRDLLSLHPSEQELEPHLHHLFNTLKNQLFSPILGKNEIQKIAQTLSLPMLFQLFVSNYPNSRKSITQKRCHEVLNAFFKRNSSSAIWREHHQIFWYESAELKTAQCPAPEIFMNDIARCCDIRHDQISLISAIRNVNVGPEKKLDPVIETKEEIPENENTLREEAEAAYDNRASKNKPSLFSCFCFFSNPNSVKTISECKGDLEQKIIEYGIERKANPFNRYWFTSKFRKHHKLSAAAWLRSLLKENNTVDDEPVEKCSEPLLQGTLRKTIDEYLQKNRVVDKLGRDAKPITDVESLLDCLAPGWKDAGPTFSQSQHHQMPNN
ncbi:MAG: NACHT domain-containing protein [Gammaproteobacteria bacterium]